MKRLRRNLTAASSSHVKDEERHDDDDVGQLNVVVKKQHTAVVPREQQLIQSYESATLQNMGQQQQQPPERIAVAVDENVRRTPVDLRPLHQETAVVEPHNVGPALKVANMPDLNVRDDSNAKFLNFLKYVGRKPDEVIARVPRMQDVMANIESMERNEKPLWFFSFPQHAINKGLELPVLEVLTPEYVAPFLREVDPNACQWERPCRPPLNPRTQQPLTCESVLMGGPVLREFLLPSQQARLMESPYFNKAAREHVINLPRDQRPCFLCCQRAVTTAFGLRKYPATKRHPKTGDDDDENEEEEQDEDDNEEVEDCIIIHDYIMSVGHVGAYNINLILSGFKRAMGICGPVIGHDRTHYALHRWQETGLQGWLQRDVLFFRAGVM